MCVNRWRPDTCGCIFEYEFDDDVPAEARVHLLKRIEKQCNEHDGINAPEECFSEATKNNKTKNITFQIIWDEYPQYRDKIFDKAGVPKSGVWSFVGKDTNRKLQVNLSDIPAVDLDDRTRIANSLKDLPSNVDIL